MLTRTGANKILQRIWQTGGLTPDMEEDINKLKDELDEREGILRKYGEVYDGEDKDEYDYVERVADNSGDTQWERKYKDLETRYMNRFFGTDKVQEEYEEINRDNKEDTRRDGEPQTWDELLNTSRKDYEDERRYDEYANKAN